jgi:hypothetical protein
MAKISNNLLNPKISDLSLTQCALIVAGYNVDRFTQNKPLPIDPQLEPPLPRIFQIMEELRPQIKKAFEMIDEQLKKQIEMDVQHHPDRK